MYLLTAFRHVFFFNKIQLAFIADPRVREFFLLKSPFPTLFILAGYLYFVLSYGPKFMEKRKAYNINTIVKYYNLIQVALCLYVAVEVSNSFLNMS